MIFKSSLWSVFGNLGEKVFTILTYILVARQVDKNQLGLIVVVFLVYELLSYVSSLGIRENIVRKEYLSDQFKSSCFIFVLGVALFIGILNITVITPFAYFFKGADLAVLFLIMTAHPMMVGLSGFYQGLLERDFHYKSLAIRKTFISFCSGLVGVMLSIYEFGIYALVAARYTYSVLNLIALIIIQPYKINRKPAAGDFKEIWKFGWKFSFSETLNFIGSKSTELVIAATLGPVALALLDVGRKLVITLNNVLLMPLGPVLLSSLRASKSKLKSYRSFVRVALVLVVSLSAIMGAQSDEIINLVFGDGWRESADVLEILSFAIVLQISSRYLASLCISHGRSGLLLQLQILNSSIVFLGTLMLTFYFDNLVDIIKGALFFMGLSSFIRVLVVSKALVHSYCVHLLLGIEAFVLYFLIFGLTDYLSGLIEFSLLVAGHDLSKYIDLVVTSVVAILPVGFYFLLFGRLALKYK
ncbi:MAG: hypothetical protein CMH97_11765 [Oceanospirillaceae bacterium]|nr:hypothetical protein [Oceanospirillaceae bacterium]